MGVDGKRHLKSTHSWNAVLIQKHRGKYSKTTLSTSLFIIWNKSICIHCNTYNHKK